MDNREDLQIFISEIFETIQEVFTENNWDRLSVDEEVDLIKTLERLEKLSEKLKKPLPAYNLNISKLIKEKSCA